MITRRDTLIDSGVRLDVVSNALRQVRATITSELPEDHEAKYLVSMLEDGFSRLQELINKEIDKES